MIDKDLLKLIGSKKNIIYSVITSVINLFINLLFTFCICISINIALQNNKVDNYIIVGLVVVLVLTSRFFLTLYSNKLKANIGEKVKVDLRANTYKKIVQLNSKAINKEGMAGLSQMSMEGIEQLDLYYSQYLPQLFYSMIAPIILFMISVFIDYKVALVLLACVPLIPMSIIAVSKYAKKIFAKYWSKYTSMGDMFLDGLNGLKDLKIFRADKQYHDKMNSSAEEFRKITMKVLVMQLFSTTIMDIIAYGGAGVGISLAIVDMVSGELSIAKGLFLILIAVEFFLPLRALGSAFHIAMNGAVAGKKIVKLLELKVDKWGSEKFNDSDIVFDNVSFSYDEKKDVLNKISFSTNKTGFYSIVGLSGSGKSTIAKLISGDLYSYSGKIMIGGALQHSLSLDDFRDNIAVISANTYLFNDTVKNNFLLSDKDATESDMWQALEKVNLDKFIKENGGLDKLINEDSANISGGQKQRLCLAINLLKKKRIYIFDEATSNIDIDSEKIILDNIIKLKEDSNVIMISHRLENVVRSDTIYYLMNGSIVEKGTHNDLMDLKGKYFEIYSFQKQLENGYKKESDYEKAE